MAKCYEKKDFMRVPKYVCTHKNTLLKICWQIDCASVIEGRGTQVLEACQNLKHYLTSSSFSILFHLSKLRSFTP